MTQPAPGSEPATPRHPYTHADDQPDQRPVDTLDPGEEYL
ncbi:hypothetical protein GGE06_005932 [Streptomyces sp. SFB5A]|uniref:Uncharacterized protein n=1 Tax=Streptomyces nymphaeiformis TaxID=2663842 RepID=A0A7W7U4N8_9ACTN|nr:hypothetical protein [Streptomyces nymphaeiformis]